MELKLYDTLTREKRPFTPIDPARVRMYVCGPTVYDYAHIGNARPVIVFDVLFRLLRHLYGEAHVKYVRNITDVDDKINARAAERGISIRQLTEETYANFKADVMALGCLPPTVEPRATEHIEEMKALIERLVASKHAYVEQDHVLFSVPSMKDYGKLSNRSLDEMIAGARVEVAPYKKDATDFVLWKPSKEGEPGWPSPCGIKAQGRPGWHIECSAMSWKHLGETFDIHGGGIDLVFPHHENEVAQSRCAFHTPVMANFWMHNGFLQVEGEKMSKSLGNFIIIHDLLKEWPGEVVRLNMLKTHYRQPMDWTVSGLEESDKVLQNWIDVLGRMKTNFTDSDLPSGEVLAALTDDLNTPRAITECHRLAGLAKQADVKSAQNLHQSLKLLGLVTHASFTRSEKADVAR
ncbi:MAG: cysteine--tRNA ligase, partial [Pseudolabrys sp.]|nr:cysteine--tRNA ligase [Pseudolabrys sp.]